VLEDPLPLHDLDVLERDRAHHRVPAERDAVREHRGLAHEGVHHPVRRDDGPDGAYEDESPFALVTMSGRMS
jgi:hypothetical protein